MAVAKAFSKNDWDLVTENLENLKHRDPKEERRIFSEYQGKDLFLALFIYICERERIQDQISEEEISEEKKEEGKKEKEQEKEMQEVAM